MPNYLPVVTKHYKPYLQSLKDDYIARKDKSFFLPTGTQIYCGEQGSGKTISAVYHIMNLKYRYPHMIIVSNLLLTGLHPVPFSSKGHLREILNTAREGVADSVSPDGLSSRRDSGFDPSVDYIYFKSMEQLSFALVEVNNGFLGVVYLIDEIHTYFNALDSKNIPMYIFTEISQQRKQRKCIIGTSQLFKRMALPFREQCDSMILCQTYFGILTVQHAFRGDFKTDYDDNIISKPKKTGWFVHNRKIRGYYDTFQKVISGSEQYNKTVVVSAPIDKKKGLFHKKGSA